MFPVLDITNYRLRLLTQFDAAGILFGLANRGTPADEPVVRRRVAGPSPGLRPHYTQLTGRGFFVRHRVRLGRFPPELGLSVDLAAVRRA